MSLNYKMIANKLIALTPIVMVIVLVIFYWLFQSLYITCDLSNPNPTGCKKFNLELLFRHVDSPTNANQEAQSFPLNHEPVDVAGTQLRTREKELSEKDTKQSLLIESRRLVAARYSGRNTWVFITFTSIILSIGSLFVAMFLIYKSERYLNNNSYVDVSIFIGISILLGLLLWSYPNFFMYNLKSILELTIINGATGIAGIVESMRFVLAFTFTVVFALIFSTCAILVARKAEPVAVGSLVEAQSGSENNISENTIDLKLQKEFDVLSGQITDLRTMLYAGTILLVVSVLRLSAVYQWSLTFIPQDEKLIKAIQSFTSSLVNDMGGFFTLVLAAVYIPAIYIIHRRAQEKFEKSIKEREIQVSEKQREKILEEHGFTFTFKEALPRSFVILSPVLAGSAGELLKAVVT